MNNNEKLRCPRCGSEDIVIMQGHRAINPQIPSAKEYQIYCHCQNCGNEVCHPDTFVMNVESDKSFMSGGAKIILGCGIALVAVCLLVVLATGSSEPLPLAFIGGGICGLVYYLLRYVGPASSKNTNIRRAQQNEEEFNKWII